MNRLKELRKEKGLTQQGLADEIGVTKLSVSNWENGKHEIKSDKAQKLADFFEVNSAYLLGYTDFPADKLKELLIHEIKALKEYGMLRHGNQNYISENEVLHVIDAYFS